MWRSLSSVHLAWNGRVTAHCHPQDARDLEALFPGQALTTGAREQLAAAALEGAWQEFRAGQAETAARGLGDTPESEIFVVPTARSKATRVLRWCMGASLGFFLFASIMASLQKKHSPTRFQPVSVSAQMVQESLSRKAAIRSRAEALEKHDNQYPAFNWILPELDIVPLETARQLRLLFLENIKTNAVPDLDEIKYILGHVHVRCAIANGWLTGESLGLTPEMAAKLADDSEFRQVIAHELNPVHIVNADSAEKDKSYKHENFTGLSTETWVMTSRWLEKLGCLQVLAVNKETIVETLLRHQVLGDTPMPGRRPLPKANCVRGLFHTMGFNPIRDTYHSLYLLEKYGGLERVQREACIQALLRYHCGGGVFACPEKCRDYAFIYGDARDTVAGYEALRILGALDRVTDLPKWQFRPYFHSEVTATNRVATWDEMEAWTCQKRLDLALQAHQDNPGAPYCSLLMPLR